VSKFKDDPTIKEDTFGEEEGRTNLGGRKGVKTYHNCKS